MLVPLLYLKGAMLFGQEITSRGWTHPAGDCFGQGTADGVPSGRLSADDLLLYLDGEYSWKCYYASGEGSGCLVQANNHEAIAANLRLKGLYHLMIGDEEQSLHHLYQGPLIVSSLTDLASAPNIRFRLQQL